MIDSPTNAKAYLHAHTTLTHAVSACAFKSLASLLGCHWLLQMNWQPMAVCARQVEVLLQEVLVPLTVSQCCLNRGRRLLQVPTPR